MAWKHTEESKAKLRASWTQERRAARSAELRGAGNHTWKGGRVIEPRGYVLIRVGVGHHLADVRGYAYEHRLVAEKKLGRSLLPDEIAHHDDEHKSNNEPNNIEPVTRAEHRKLHRKLDKGLRDPGEPNPKVTCACECGASFLRFDNSGRPRRFISGHNSLPRNAKGQFNG